MKHAWPECEKCGKVTPSPYYITVKVTPVLPTDRTYETIRLCTSDGFAAQKIPLSRRTREAVLA